MSFALENQLKAAEARGEYLEQLLSKYIDHVETCEGFDFIDLITIASAEDRELSIRNAGILSELIRKNGVVNGVFCLEQITPI